ncbi:MAG: hypothetical protein OEL89_02095 [Candidatus Peregrinibacteria bacterium]|nr:hypothetical protein [Candidatus Peregrinibacteria bacterium]
MKNKKKNKNKLVKIKLRLGDTGSDILRVFEKIKAKKVLFICPRNFTLLSEITFLKKIKSIAKKFGKEIDFVVHQKYFREILTSQKIENFFTIPDEYLEIETEFLAKILGADKVSAEKNKGEKILEEEFSPKGRTAPPKFATRKIEPLDQKKSIRGYVFFTSLFLIILLLGVWLWISPAAKITIKPKISIVPIAQNILVKFVDAEVSKDNEFLPAVTGIFVETEIEDTEVFPSTGRTYDLTNARGFITLFNETSKEKYLIPSRLSTADGAIFRFRENVTIPPKKDNIPGQVSVEIFADEYDEKERPIGERGNIEAGTELFFPALRKESRDLYYGKANKGPLVGGSTLTHYLVAETDFEKAAEILSDRFRIRAIEKLSQEIQNRSNREAKKYILLDDPRLLKIELVEAKFPEELVGQETQTFSVTAKLKLSGIVFDQDEVVVFLKDKMQKTQDHRKKLINIDKNSVQYTLMEYGDLEEDRWLKLSVNMAGVETLNLDANNPTAREWR